MRGLTVAVGIILVGFATPVSAADLVNGGVQAYSATSPLNTGTIVQLANKGAMEVQAALQTNLQNMFGVVIDPNQLSAITSGDNLQNKTYVAVSGTFNVLVSTQNGTINKGDYITLSALSGVAMKAGTFEEQGTVLGRAQAAFDGKGLTLGTSTLKDSAGVTKNVVIGAIPVSINIQRNPNQKSTKVDVPEFLQRLGQQIAEKQVSPIRIYLSLAIAAVSLITALIVVYSGIRNSIISLGRNPMSKKTIFRALLEIILTSFLILIIGLFAVYLLLKL